MWGFPGGSTVQNPAAVQETQVQSLGQEDPWRRAWPPTLAWRIPRTEEPGRLQSILSKRVEDGQNDLGCTHSHTYFPDAFSSSAFFGLPSCSSQWMFYGAWLILSTMWHFCLCFILPAKLQPLGSCHCVPGTERVWIKQISLQDWCSSKIHILQLQMVPQPLTIVSLVLGSWLLFSIAIAPSLHLPTVCQQMTLLS